MIVHTTTIVTLELELEVDCFVRSAEPDVGIMQDYIEEIEVTAVNGITDKELCHAVECKLIKEDELIEQLTDEGTAQ